MLLFTLRDLGNDKTIIKLAEDELNLKLNGKDTPEEDKKMRATAATRYLVLLAFFVGVDKRRYGKLLEETEDSDKYPKTFKQHTPYSSITT